MAFFGKKGKRLVLVSKFRLPDERGIGFALAMMAKALSEVGWQVEVWAPDRAQTESLERTDFWDYYRFKKGLFILRKFPVLELPAGTILEFLFGHIRYFLLSWVFSWRAFVSLWRSKREVVYVIVDAREVLVLLRMWRFLYHPFVIYEVHHRAYTWYDRLLEALGLSRVDCLVTNTQATADHYVGAGVKKERVLACHNGVDLADFDYRSKKRILREKLGLPKDRQIVGFGGRFTVLGLEKGISDLVKATRLLRRDQQKIFLVCVGGPADYVRKYQEEARALGVDKDCRFLDGVSVRKLYEYMRAFDVCVMPYPWHYHFAYSMSPLKMFEYMASKNPIVATDLPVVREVLKDKVNCVFVRPGDPSDLAAGISYLLDRPRIAAGISRRAFAEVASRCTWRARAKKISERVASRYSDRFLAR